MSWLKFEMVSARVVRDRVAPAASLVDTATEEALLRFGAGGMASAGLRVPAEIKPFVHGRVCVEACLGVYAASLRSLCCTHGGSSRGGQAWRQRRSAGGAISAPSY